MKRWLLACLALLLAVVTASAQRGAGDVVQRGPGLSMNTIAERYVKLVLAVGQHDADYVDAFYGPPEWKAEAERQKMPLAQIDAEAERLIGQIPDLSAADRGDPLVVLRREYLRRQLEALRARLRMLQGAKLTFDEESQALYDAVAPVHPESFFKAALDELGTAAPGRRPARRPLRRLPPEVRHPAGPADARLRPGDCRMPQADAPARASPGQRNIHRRVRHEQVVERLQLVSGQLPQPDPGQHGPADLHRPRDRSRVPRGLSGPPRLQRAARAAPRARAGLGGILGLRAVLAAVAHRRGHRQLRHRSRVSGRGTDQIRARGAVPRGRPRRLPGGAVRAGSRR